MLWCVTKLLLYELLFLVLVYSLYWTLRRYEPVRKVVVSYHVLVALLAVGIFLILASGYGLINPGFFDDNPKFMKFLIGAIVFFAVLVVLRLADSVLVGYLLSERLGVRISVLARHLAVVILLAATIILVLAGFGVEIGPLLATSAVGTAIIGLALQDVLGNVIAGVALQAERPFKVGDWVLIGEIEGCVVETNWRATKVKTLDADHVIIPNSMVARERIRNFHAPTRAEARHVSVGVEYQAPPGQVKSVLMEAALGAEGVLSEPAPRIWLIKYGDFEITYEIKFWLDRFADYRDIEDNVMTRIWYLFRRNQITIPFPIRNIYHHKALPTVGRPGLKPGGKAVTAILRGVELLEPLSTDELQRLSSRVKVALYNVGEGLVSQNEPGDSFLVIESGEVSVRVNDVEVARLADRGHFGEMSLLTGQPRIATVVALTDTRVLIIDRDAFESILRANPTVAERLSSILERVNAENLAKLQAQGIADPEAKPASAGWLLGNVLNFFHLK